MPNPHLLCTLSPSLSLLFFFFFIFFILSFHAVHSAFSTICEPVSSTSQCGSISIQYPFWIVSDAAEHCGYPGLGINCSSGWDYPILSLPNYSYSVTEINYTDQTLTLVDMEVAHQSCPRARHNLTMGSLPLNYNSADANLTFFFNCSAPPKAPIPASVISCLRFGDNQSYVFVDMSQVEAAAFGETLDCQDMVVAAVKRTKVSAANVVEEFAGAMSQGFVLDWEAANECSTCERSGGRCSFNRMENMQCFCGDGSNYGDRSFCGGKNEVCICS